MSRNFLVFISIFIFPIISTSLASEKSTYNFGWLDPDKEVYVLQNRKFRKVKRFGAAIGLGATTSGAFVNSRAYQFRLNYFFKEEFGLEFLYAVLDGKENNTARSVRHGTTSGTVPFRRITENYMGLLAQWAPFYSKLNTFNKIFYMDWIFSAGYGSLSEENNRAEFETTSEDALPVKEDHSAFIWGVGVKFYINKHWDVRGDFTTLHYKAIKASVADPESVFYQHMDLSISASYRF